MNCKAFRKYAGAFADGELEIRDNVEALEHLNMCAVCAAKVAEITAIKASIKRAYGGVGASSLLRHRIRRAIEAEAVASRSPVRSNRRLRRRFSWGGPLALAASLVIAVTLWPGHHVAEPRIGALTVVPGRAVADVRQQHRICVSRRMGSHHDPTLPRDLRKIEAILGKRLHLKVLAPDLSAFGFELVGADRCGIRGRPGAHILYRSPTTGQALSVFTVERMPGLDVEHAEATPRQDYFVASDEPLSVVGWQEGRQTYVVCSLLPEPSLVKLVNAFRVEEAG